MTSYLSFSANRNEDHLISILIDMLDENHFSVSTNHSLAPPKSMRFVNIFIGLVAASNQESNTKVLEQWQSARKERVPSLLLVDKKTLKTIPEDFLKEADGTPIKNIIPFNKSKPMEELKLVKEKINQASYQFENVW